VPGWAYECKIYPGVLDECKKSLNLPLFAL